MIIRNWRDVHPVIAHKSGTDWRLLSMAVKTHGDIEAEVEPKYQCLKAITYVSLAMLEPGLSYEPHEHKDHEEVYYITKGRGSIRIDNEVGQFKDGDIIYIPEKTMHSMINDGKEAIEFLAFGGVIGTEESEITELEGQ